MDIGSQSGIDEISSPEENRGSKQEAATKAASNSEYLRSTLFQNITHELRTPLTLIKGPAAQLLNSSDISGENRQQLIRIYRNARRLSQLVEQLLDLERLDAGQLSLSAQKVELSAYVTHLADSFASLMESKEITLHCEVPRSDIWVYLDPDKFEKIISNLITNATKFTPRKGQIWLTLDEFDNEVVIGIEDSGVGINNERIHQIFDRFETAASLDMAYREGLGIGLSLTREYLQLHGAEISVQSEEKRGTLFEITLRKGKEHLPDDAVTDRQFKIKEAFIKEPLNLGKERLVSGNRHHVLLIEDNREMSNYITEVLGNRNFAVEQAYDGEEGLRLAKTYRPDIIISDVMMPIMDGFELLEQLRMDEELKYIPTIFLTALSDMEDRLKGLRIGVNDYVVKPFNTDELLIRIQNLLEFSEMRRERVKYDRNIPFSVSDLFADDEFLQTLTKLVEERMAAGSISTDEIAKEFSISRRTLYREIKRMTGFSAAGFFKEVRLQHARHLAETGMVSDLKKLSEKVGFSNSTYFRNEFVARFGKEPFE